jgi:membrane-associated phospholipid phosphatase
VSSDWPVRSAPLASVIDDWGRWFLRSYLGGSLATLGAFTLISFGHDVPGPRWLNFLTAAVIVPVVTVVVSLVFRLRALRRGRLVITPVDADPAPGWRGNVSQARWLLATLAMFVAWPAFYTAASKLGALSEPVRFSFAIDRQMPFRTEFSMIYSGVYWFFIFPALFGKGMALFWPLLRAYATLMVVCSAFFILYPVDYPRDPIVVRTLGDWTLSVIHRFDPTNNCFPSTHCAVSMLSALALRDMNRKAWYPGLAVALGICLATVMTRQHYLVDTLAGMALGSGAYLYFFRPELRQRLRGLITARG